MRAIKNTKQQLFSIAFFAAVIAPALLLIASCAQVAAPGGGPRDQKAPKVLRYTPDSAQLNFQAKYIQLDFDEYIQLKDLNNQLLISPPFAKTPEVKVKNKTLTIDLSKETLLPNTTYSINFGNALADNNEGNALENFRYIFSTGSYIDSLSVKGKVQTAFDHKTEKGIMVMLYSSTSDSAVYKGQPDYFGKTTAEGTFEITNIRPGSYRIYALKDGNSNFKYDGDETLGFIAGTVEAGEKKDILIETFTENPKKVFVKKYVHNSYGKVMLYFNTGADSIHVKNLSPDVLPQNEIFVYSKNKDTLTYWMSNYDKDSLKLQVMNDTAIIDTVEFKLIKKEDALKAKRGPLKLFLSNSPNRNQAYDLTTGIRFQFSQPIASVKNVEAIEFQEDSTAYKTKFVIGLAADNKAGDTYRIGYWDSTKITEDPNNPGTFVTAPEFKNYPLKESTGYRIYIPPGTFTDIFGLTNDSIKIDFKTREQKFYGSLRLKVTVPETKGKYIVQLMDEKESVVREVLITKTQVMDFEYLYPNKYKVKLIYDENGNGQWDSGNYMQQTQPEKVIYNAEQIQIRSNWDADIEWNLNVVERKREDVKGAEKK